MLACIHTFFLNYLAIFSILGGLIDASFMLFPYTACSYPFDNSPQGIQVD